MNDNIILIGMPGSGKSTLGVQLAKSMGLNFIDTDLLIQQQEKQLLQEILEEKGYLALRDIEARTLLSLQLERELISTGGSAVYSEQAMQHLAKQGTIIYLEVTLPELKKRINNEHQRGIARPSHHTLDDVYHERTPLYEHYAHITIDNNQTMNCADIISKIQHR